MTCITEILKLKGDLDFLKAPRPRSSVGVEGGGHYKGYEYLITFNDMGFRCGYVAIPPDHPTNNFNGEYKYPDFNVHGGVTFFDQSHLAAEFFKDNHCIDKWIGFDAGHCGDARDLKCAITYFPNMCESSLEHLKILDRTEEMSTIKTFIYMEDECKRIIDQLIDEKEAA